MRTILTEREVNILCLVSKGWQNKHIAAILGISRKTVANHRNKAMQKLHCHNVAQVTRHMIENGYLKIVERR